MTVTPCCHNKKKKSAENKFKTGIVKYFSLQMI